MDKITQILKNALAKYEGEALNGYSYLTESLVHQMFTIVSVGEYKGKQITFTDLVVKIVGNKIVIIEDRNSDPFYEELLEAGIPREQIILAYAGEPVPDTA